MREGFSFYSFELYCNITEDTSPGGIYMAKEKEPVWKNKPKKTTTFTERNAEKTAAQSALLMKRWELIRKEGQLKYVLKYGIMRWTLMTSGIYFLVILVSAKLVMTLDMIIAMLPTIGLFVLLGILFGLVTWKLSENRYEKYLTQPRKYKK